MSLADDILFEPVSKASPVPNSQHQALLDDVAAALKGTRKVEFSIDQSFPITIYDRIVDLVESDPDQIKFLDYMVYKVGSRPSNALTMKDVFRRLMVGETEFYHCGRAATGGSRIGQFHLKNIFGIVQRHPYLLLDQMTSNNHFEWWAASLISTHAGHHEHYSFATRDEAHKYYYYHNIP